MSKSLVGLDFLSMGIALRNAFFCSAESIIIADKPPHSKKRSGFIPGALLLSFLMFLASGLGFFVHVMFSPGITFDLPTKVFFLMVDGTLSKEIQ